jgi:hypothetical protein
VELEEVVVVVERWEVVIGGGRRSDMMGEVGVELMWARYYYSVTLSLSLSLA